MINLLLPLLLASRVSVFGIAARIRSGRSRKRGSIPCRGKGFLFSHPNQFWDLAYLLFNDCWRSKDGHLPPSTAEVKNEWSYTSAPPICRPAAYRNSFLFLPIRLASVIILGTYHCFLWSFFHFKHKARWYFNREIYCHCTSSIKSVEQTVGRMRLKCDGTRAETRFRLSTKRTSPFKSAGASVQSTTGSRVVRISGSNAGYTMFWSSVKGTGYPLHSPISPSLPLPCVTVCHYVSDAVYTYTLSI